MQEVVNLVFKIQNTLICVDQIILLIISGDMSATVLFLGSVLVYGGYKVLFDVKKDRHTLDNSDDCIENVVSDYVATLTKMFQPIKLQSRHNEKKSTTQEIFLSRRNFFRKLYNKNVSLRCRVIHVAGTKGKGSTVEYISSCLIANNKRVGVFTSPHLHTARERIRFGRELISQAEMVQFGSKSLELLKNCSFSVFFDLLLATALQFFGERNCEYIVFESGIGGRFDSTNFLEAPVACVICSISLDHQSTLGNTIEEIAWQKAGIVKRNSHVFTPSTQRPSVLEVFRKQCDALDATLHVVPVDRWAKQRYVLLNDQPLNPVCELVGTGCRPDWFWRCLSTCSWRTPASPWRSASTCTWQATSACSSSTGRAAWSSSATGG